MSIARGRWLLRSVCFGCAGWLIFETGGVETALAQATLPEVTVDAPRQRQTVRRAAPRRTASRPRASTRVAAPSPRQQPAQPNVGATQRGAGPITGYVANEGVTATKTTTPIIEIPQSISVIGAEQIRDQKLVSKFDEILRYTPGSLPGPLGRIIAMTGS